MTLVVSSGRPMGSTSDRAIGGRAMCMNSGEPGKPSAIEDATQPPGWSRPVTLAIASRHRLTDIADRDAACSVRADIVVLVLETA